MNTENLSNYHYAYMSMIRHWHPESEKYTGGDALFTALENGWDVAEEVEFQEHWYAGSRGVTIYHFHLRRGDEQMTMRVVTNPFVRRMVRDSKFRLVKYDGAKAGQAVGK